MDLTSRSIPAFFQDLLTDLPCQPDTRAYIVSIFGKYKSAEQVPSQDSLTVWFCQARERQNFDEYQKIGDWIFWLNSLAPQHLQSASKDYYHALAQTSYYTCYRLLNKQWKLYEEMADRLVILEEQVKHKLSGITF
jgi:hypothetical protein